jgi:hypothetical protein
MYKWRDYIPLIALAVIILIVLSNLCSCISNPKISPEVKAVEIKDSQVSNKFFEKLNSPSQKSIQEVKAGGNVNQFNLSFAGGGAAVTLIIICFSIVYIKRGKALNACIDSIETTGKGSPLKSIVCDNANALNIENYLHKLVKKRYSK